MRITHDFHIHTNLSSCAKETATVAYYVDMARKLGLQKIGFTDHFWDDKIPGADKEYHSQNLAHILQLKPFLEKMKTVDIQLYFGAESEYDPIRRDIAITEESAEQLDFLIVPTSHTHKTMPKAYFLDQSKTIDFLVQAYEDVLNSSLSRYITAMAHPFEPLGCPNGWQPVMSGIPEDTYRRLFDKTAEKGIAVEINTSCFQKGTDTIDDRGVKMKMLKIAKECGCKFTFGSDSHDDKKHAVYNQNNALIVEFLSLKENDIAVIAR